MCETWILLAFLGWMPPLRIDGFQTPEQCETTGKRVEGYCLKSDRDPKPCKPVHYCIEGPPAPCVGRPPPHE